LKIASDPDLQMQVDINNVFEKLNEKIEDLNVDDASRELLKKIIEYMRKYHEKIEETYISFNMCIVADNKEEVRKIVSILEDAVSYFKYARSGNAAMYSMYDVEKADDIDKIYTDKVNIVVLRELEGFATQEQNVKEKFLHKLNEYSNKFEKQVLTILTAKNKDAIDNFFDKNDELRSGFEDFVIITIKPDVQDVYQEVWEKVKNIVGKDSFELELLDYISNTYPKTEKSYPNYRDSLIEQIAFNKAIPEFEKEKTMDEIFAELNELVGLEKVKKVLKELVSLIELKKKDKELKIGDINLHMVFLGNPGTGKTTVARIIAHILYNLGYIRQDKLVEVTSKDLVAEYVGQTAPKTNAVIQKSLGGVLFVDEAYALASGHGQSGSSFNEEAIATLIQGMENNRDDLVVIFAGYTKEMQDFLNANSGIVSRIGYTLEFEDYTPDELIAIFKIFTKKAGFTVTDEAEAKVREIIDEYKDGKNFGNARFIRNVYEKSVLKHAANTENIKQKKRLKTLTVEDISSENLLK